MKKWPIMGLLLVLISTGPAFVDVEATGNEQLKSNCFFPNYLQTNCSKPHGVCRWSQGKRFASREFAILNQWRNYQGHGEWNWEVRNGIAIAVRAKDTSWQKIYSCQQKLGSEKFVVSYKDSRSDNIVNYACIHFKQRGLNVVEYNISSFEKYLNNTRCDDELFTTQEAPLLANVYLELPDCPTALQGGHKIVKIYNKIKKYHCSFKNSVFTTFESDCLAKEGLYIDLGQGSNCSNDFLHNVNIYDASFRCYSRPWSNQGLTYFIAARRPRSQNEYRSLDFRCVIFEELNVRNGSNFMPLELIKLYIFNDPICPPQGSLVNESEHVSYIFYLERHQNNVDLYEDIFFKPGCNFPKELLGNWIEKSTHLGTQEIKIEKTHISIPPYGKFLCIQRYTFNRENPNHCIDSTRGGQWLGKGRVRFYFDDFIVSSNSSNGCRPRITRLGLTEILQNKALVYRLSQSEPLRTRWSTLQEYFRLMLLRRFCSAFYLFEKDPYPFWGRNIEKILLKTLNIQQSKTECSLINERNIMYKFKASYTDPQLSTCVNDKTWIEFDCKRNSDTAEIHVKYGNNCTYEDTVYVCLGKLKRFGEFTLIKNKRKDAIYCTFYDKEKKLILRMSSPQCSDVDWGVTYGRGSNFHERFELGYPSRCPVKLNNDRSSSSLVPPIRNSNSAQSNDKYFKTNFLITFLVFKLCSEHL